MQATHSFFAHPDGRGSEKFLAGVAQDAIRQYLLGQRHAYLVAEQDGTLLGALGVRDRRHIFHLFIAESVRRRGIARALWLAGLHHLFDAGTITVNASLVAVPVYEAFGFSVSGARVERDGVVFVPMWHPGPVQVSA